MKNLPDTSSEKMITEKMISSQEIFKGNILRLRLDHIEMPNGLKRTREVIEHPGGAVVAPIFDDGRILFVSQYRYALERTMLELPAGKLDVNDGVVEDPFETIQRELTEETGYSADHWEFLMNVYTAPGFCNEKLWLYKASGLKKQDVIPREEDEFIDCVTLTMDEAFEKIRNQEIVDAKTVCILGLLAHSK